MLISTTVMTIKSPKRLLTMIIPKQAMIKKSLEVAATPQRTTHKLAARLSRKFRRLKRSGRNLDLSNCESSVKQL